MIGRGLSLANKCQLLFGAAVVLVISVALVIPWFRLEIVVDQAQLETSRQIAQLWESELLIDPSFARVLAPPERAAALERQLRIEYHQWEPGELDIEPDSEFVGQARRRFEGIEEDGGRDDFSEALWEGEARRYRYAKVIRDEEGGPKGILIVDRRSLVAASQLFVDRVYLIVAGLGAGVISMLVFYLITTRLILGPVRSLRDTAEVVEAGNLHVRSSIKTGDEFEQLSKAFNSMLETLASQQAQLRSVNKSLDLRLGELAERNVALFESARVKGEFLANVSHELRTPLNSIIGFAEILREMAEPVEDGPTTDGAMIKRRRYLENILTAGRTLLEMINELLMMAKLDAGTMELNLQKMNVAETCEGLAALIRPLADRRQQTVELQLQGRGRFVGASTASDLPLVETDPQKLQQILFNFLSNAVKFTPEGGLVTLRAERIAGSDEPSRVRVSVLDTGPGIPTDKREVVFEKFSQLEGGHTRTSQGTGLGLAIASEFAAMLGCEIQLESEVGRGSMFSLIVPQAFKGKAGDLEGTGWSIPAIR